MPGSMRRIQKELIDLWDATGNIYLRIYRRWNLSAGMFNALYYLKNEPAGIEPNRLAERLGGIKQTVTPILREFSSRGLILRKEQKTDHRKKLIVLSKRGIKFAEEVFAAADRADARALSALSAREQQQFLDLSRRYYEAIRDCPESMEIR